MRNILYAIVLCASFSIAAFPQCGALAWNGVTGELNCTGPSGGAPTGAAGGSLAGTYPNPTIGTLGQNLIFTDATYDIGASGATRPRDLFLSRDLTVGRNLTIGASLLGAATAKLAPTGTTGPEFWSEIPDSLADGAALTPVLAGAGAGNLSNGAYSYKFTMAAYRGSGVYTGETAAVAATPTVTVVDSTTNGQVTVQLPYTCDEASSEQVNIYRTSAGGSVYKYVAGPTFACGRTFTDNVADASLGATIPTTNTTLARRLSITNGALAAAEGDGFGDGTINLSDTSGNGFFELIGSSSRTVDGSGTTVHIQAGRNQGTGNAGYLILDAGPSEFGTPGHVVIRGGGVGTAPVDIYGTFLTFNDQNVFPSLTGTTGSIGGGALLAGACASGTVAVTGATTSMTVAVSPNTYPGDGTDFSGYVSTNGTVTVKVCALVAVTPTASTYNVRVIQ